MIPSREEVLRRLFGRLYGSPVVRNDLRGELVEEIVGIALEPEWRLTGSDWGACDLQHEASSQRIQVKQSAAKQSWVAGNFGYGPARFSIATKTGRYEGANWVSNEGRNADIFVFAWNDATGPDCDHADPAQWRFLVVAEADLPAQKSIGMRQLERLTTAVDFFGLGSRVQAVMTSNFDPKLAPTATV